MLAVRKAGPVVVVRSFLLRSPVVTIWIGRIAGVLFIAVALWSAWHALSGLTAPSPSPAS